MIRKALIRAKGLLQSVLDPLLKAERTRRQGADSGEGATSPSSASAVGWRSALPILIVISSLGADRQAAGGRAGGAERAGTVGQQVREAICGFGQAHGAPARACRKRRFKESVKVGGEEGRQWGERRNAEGAAWWLIAVLWGRARGTAWAQDAELWLGTSVRPGDEEATREEKRGRRAGVETLLALHASAKVGGRGVLALAHVSDVWRCPSWCPCA